jgi:hypothetical protein
MKHFLLHKYNYYFFIYYNNHEKSDLYRFDILDINQKYYLYCKNKDNELKESFIIKILNDGHQMIIETPSENTNLLPIIGINNINLIKKDDSRVIPFYNNYKFEFNIENDILKIKRVDSNSGWNNHLKCFLYKKQFEGETILTIGNSNNNEKHIKINSSFDRTKLIDNNYLNMIKNRYPQFDPYIYNYKLAKDSDKLDFIYYHWHFIGYHNKQEYFKYVLNQNKEKIHKLDYPKIKYDDTKTKTLLFIDDRYDGIFELILRLFLYSVDNSWNLTIFTIEESKVEYENILKNMDISAKIFLLDEKIDTLDNYNKILSSVSFWKRIKEENCLIFQYDAISFGKFSNDFFKYNYIGAKWEHDILMYGKLSFGNGGISFRKTRIMEYICNKYKNDLLFPEDVFFCAKLKDENLLYCPNYILNTFSFENIYNENTVYGHRIYNIMSHEKLKWFIEMKIDKLFI